MSRRSASKRPSGHASRRLSLGIVFAGLSMSGLTGVIAGSVRAASDEGVIESISGEVKAVFERAKDAVVKIEAVDENGHLAGTGFFIDPEGTVYTSYSVGGESHDIIVCHGD